MIKTKWLLLAIFLIFFGRILYAQNKIVSYRNLRNSYEDKDSLKTIKAGPLKGLSFFGETRVNEITLNTDSTFNFWSRPNFSCFTWGEYKGTWKRSKDTVLFYNNYGVIQNDVSVTYNRDKEHMYHISFFTDKNSELKNKKIKVGYMYDYDSHLEGAKKLFYLNANNEIRIPFTEISNHNKLSAITIEYMLNGTNKRYGCLTQNRISNIRSGKLPNLIKVTFVENLEKQIVYRTIKGLLRNNTLEIVSTIKSKITLPDYYPEIMFEKIYTLDK